MKLRAQMFAEMLFIAHGKHLCVCSSISQKRLMAQIKQSGWVKTRTPTIKRSWPRSPMGRRYMRSYLSQRYGMMTWEPMRPKAFSRVYLKKRKREPLCNIETQCYDSQSTQKPLLHIQLLYVQNANNCPYKYDVTNAECFSQCFQRL